MKIYSNCRLLWQFSDSSFQCHAEKLCCQTTISSLILFSAECFGPDQQRIERNGPRPRERERASRSRSFPQPDSPFRRRWRWPRRRGWPGIDRERCSARGPKVDCRAKRWLQVDGIGGPTREGNTRGFPQKLDSRCDAEFSFYVSCAEGDDSNPVARLSLEFGFWRTRLEVKYVEFRASILGM